MKTIQLTDEIYTAFINLLEGLETKQMPLSDWLLVKTMINTIKQQGEKDCSVIEWHGFNEMPESGRFILVRHEGKSVPFEVFKVGEFVAYCFDRHYNKSEWAYLPD